MFSRLSRPSWRCLVPAGGADKIGGNHVQDNLPQIGGRSRCSGCVILCCSGVGPEVEVELEWQQSLAGQYVGSCFFEPFLEKFIL